MPDDLLSGPTVDRIDQWERGFIERAAQAKALAARTAELSATVRAPGGLVEVTVGADGQITRLRLDEEIRRQSASTTEQQIMAAIRAAQLDLIRQYGEVIAETVGAESETGRAVLAGLAERLRANEDEASS
ncbi:YbaB/EbfC family nucleoid-associated protein [Actinoplanes sp. NPDC051494]|uniref:YbaB/EbfC family nucleoid-associated protein n=1 Tax=Actinoplanes sp. NPDC051494 TaxID=3363907 RepID=UPI0037908EBB